MTTPAPPAEATALVDAAPRGPEPTAPPPVTAAAETEVIGPLVLDAPSAFHRRVGRAILTLGATTTLTASALAALTPLDWGLFHRPLGAITWPLPLVLELLARRAARRDARAQGPETPSDVAIRHDRREGLARGAIAVVLAIGLASLASPLLGGLALGLAFALDWTRRAPRRLVRAAIGAVPLGVAAAYAAQLWLAAGDRFDWPSPLGALVAGVVGGLIVGLGALSLHVGLQIDPVARAAARLTLPQTGTLGGLVNRALAAHTALAREAPRPGVDRARVSALVVRVLEIAARAAELERALQGPRVSEITARLDALDARITAAADDVASAALRKARATLEAQARAADQVRRALARIEARLEAHVALLDRLAFAATFARSVDTERLGEAPAPAVPELEALSSELDATAAAVGEVYGRLDP